MISKFFKGILAAMLLPIYACQNNSYTVTGQIEGAQDGDSVFIACLNETQWDICDTLIISNQQFVLNGEADSCAIYSFWTEHENGAYQGFFFTEPGDISLSVTAEKTILKGTPLNDRYQQVTDSLYIFGDRINALYESGDPTSADVALQGEALNLQIKEYIKRQLAANIDNQVGFFLLITHANLLTPEEMEQIIGTLPETTRKHPIIRNIETVIAQLKKSAVGQPYTDITLNDPEGKSFRLSDYVAKNKITVLDFWASWCGPCMVEMPEMVKLYSRFRSQGVEFIGISLDTDEQGWKKAISEKGMTWPQGAELTDWQQNEGARAYHIESIPHTVIVSQDGKILTRGLRAAELEEFLQETLAGETDR